MRAAVVPAMSSQSQMKTQLKNMPFTRARTLAVSPVWFCPRAVEARPIKQGQHRGTYTSERLRYWDAQKKQYVVESGDYEFLVGAASDDIRLRLPMKITD